MATPQPKLTYEDYLRFPEDGCRHQIIDGELCVSKAPPTRHQELVGRLLLAIGGHLQAHGGGELLPGRICVVLSEIDVVEPDLIFVSDADAFRITEANIQGPPTLVIEVFSDSTLDRRLKRELYARYGVQEYWIVDHDADWVEVYRPSTRGYGKPEILEPGDVLTTALLPGLEIDLTDLFRR